MTHCQGCGVELAPKGPGQEPKWCSNRCRKQTRYTGTCIDCGGRTGYSGTSTPRERCAPCATEHKRTWTHEVVIEAIQLWAELYGEPPSALDWNVSNHVGNAGHEHRLTRFYDSPHVWPHITTVVRLFGTWSAGLAAAGFKPRPIGGKGLQRPLTQHPFRAEALEMYRRGATASEVAETYECSTASLYGWAHKAGIYRHKAAT